MADQRIEKGAAEALVRYTAHTKLSRGSRLSAETSFIGVRVSEGTLAEPHLQNANL